MQKLAKRLSAVMVAVFTIFSALTAVPVTTVAASAAVKPIAKIAQQPNATYTQGDILQMKLQAPNYRGRVEYKVVIENLTTKEVTNLFGSANLGYYTKTQPSGLYAFPIHWGFNSAGKYRVFVYVRPANTKIAMSTYAVSSNFEVAPKNDAAAAAETAVAAYEKVLLDTPDHIAAADALRTAAVQAVANVTDATQKAAFQARIDAMDKKVADAKVLKVNSVTAIQANQLKVAFNNVVDTTKASFAVKKGNLTVNYSSLAWNDAKTEATVTLYSNMTAGTYTVNVTGLGDAALSGSATVEDQKVAQIQFSSDTLVLGSTVNGTTGNLDTDYTKASVGFKLLDQYGTDVTKAKKGEISWTATSTTSTDGTSTVGVLKLTNSANYTLGSKVIVNGIDTTTGAYVNATLTVGAMAQASQITFGNVTPVANYTGTVVYTNNLDKFFIPVTVLDQYGNKMTDKNVVAANLLALKANVDFTFDNDEDGNLILDLKAATGEIAGPASITFVGKTTGVRASTQLTVNKTSQVTDFSMDVPALIVAGDTTKVTIPFNAVDQYGNAVTDPAVLNAMFANVGVSGTTLLDKTDFTFVKDYTSNTTKLQLDVSGAAKGTAYLTLVTPGQKVYQTSFDVQAAAEPSLISGTTDLITNVVKGATTATIKATNLVLKDQYGRTFSWDNFDGVNYKVVLSTSDATKVALSATELTAKAGVIDLTVPATGTSTITATLQKNNAGTFENVEGSTYSWTETVVKASDVANYTVDDIGTLYAPTATDADYEKDLVVTGTLANGSKVVLDDYAVVSAISTDNAVLTVDQTNGLVYAVPVATDRPTTNATASVVVTIDGANGPVIITKPVTISYAAPVAATIKASDDVTNGVYYVTSTNVDDALAQFVVTDQYGVDIYPMMTYVVTNVNTASATGAVGFNTTTGSVTLVNTAAGDSFTLTAITPNGKPLSIKVVLTE